ncbi:MAG: hypothetical protein ACFB6R_05440 [Alphaproteobacteria bacterium]
MAQYMDFDIRTKGTSYFTEGDPQGSQRVEFTITGGGTNIPPGANYVKVYYYINHGGTDADDFAGRTVASRLVKLHENDGHAYASATVHFNINKDDLIERDETFTVSIEKVVYVNHAPKAFTIPITTQDYTKDGKTPPTSDPVWIFNDDFPPAAQPLIDKIGELKSELGDIEGASEEDGTDEEDPAKDEKIKALKDEIKELEGQVDDMVEEEVKAREAESKRKAEEDQESSDDGASVEDGTVSDTDDGLSDEETVADDSFLEDEDVFFFEDAQNETQNGPDDARSADRMPADTGAFQHHLAAELGLDGAEIEAFIDDLAPLGFDEETFTFADGAADAEQLFADFFLAQGFEGEAVFEALDNADASFSDIDLDMAEFAFLHHEA